MRKPNYMTPNPVRNETGGMTWEHAPGQRAASPKEADAARVQFGAGWHTLTSLVKGGMSGDELFALLRANYLRLDGWLPHCEDEPVYLLFF